MGLWKDDQTSGVGIFWHSGGDLYVGEFKHDQAHGYGVYLY